MTAATALAAVATKTTAGTAVVWVIARPCFFLGLHAKEVKNWLTMAKFGLQERTFQADHLYAFNHGKSDLTRY
jgi:hypothetical protein